MRLKSELSWQRESKVFSLREQGNPSFALEGMGGSVETNGRLAVLEDARVSRRLEERSADGIVFHSIELALSEPGLLWRWNLEKSDAELHIRRAAELSPADPAPVFRLALLAGARGDISQAKFLLQRTLTLDPNYPPARVLLDRLESP